MLTHISSFNSQRTSFKSEEAACSHTTVCFHIITLSLIALQVAPARSNKRVIYYGSLGTCINIAVIPSENCLSAKLSLTPRCVL